MNNVATELAKFLLMKPTVCINVKKCNAGETPGTSSFSAYCCVVDVFLFSIQNTKLGKRVCKIIIISIAQHRF